MPVDVDNSINTRNSSTFSEIVQKIRSQNLNLSPYTRQEIEQLFPLSVNPETVHSRDMAAVVRESTTRESLKPYENSQISLLRTNPGDPEDIMSKIRPCTTYLNIGNLENLAEFDIYLRSFGVDMFNLSDVAVINDPVENNPIYIAPPVVEKNEDGTFTIVDGHHRFYLAMYFGIPINFVCVENFNQDHCNPYQPLTWSQVEARADIPVHSQKHLLLPDHSEADLVEMNLAGDRGSRAKGLPKEASHFQENPTVGSKKRAKNLQKQTNQLLAQINPDSPDFAGMFPSAVFSSPEGLSRVESVRAVYPLTDDYFLAVIDVSLALGNQEKKYVYYATAPTRRNIINTSSSLVVALAPTEKFAKTGQTQPAGEVVFPKDIRAEINREMAARNLRQLAPEDNPDLPMTLSDGSSLPKIEGFEIVDVGKQFHTEVILKLNNGHKISYVVNRQENKDGNQINGSIFVIRTPEDKIILVKHYRELYGMTLLELPRMFGFDLKRLEKETGYHLTSDLLKENSEFSEDIRISTTKPTVFSIALPAESKINTQVVENENYFELSTTVEMSDTEIHRLIASGELSCNLTNAAITQEQIKHGKLAINSDHLSDSLVLEKFYSAADGKYYLQPVATKTGAGQRYGKNVFPNTGVELNFRHIEIGDSQSLPSEKCYVQVPMSEVFDLMTNGTLDSDAIANLSTVLRFQDIIKPR